MIDNVSFFVNEVAVGDAVMVTVDDDGNLWFSGVRSRSGNSLLRVVLFDRARLEELLRGLDGLGVASEVHGAFNLVAIDVPPDASLASVESYLRSQAALGWLDYEEPILRQ